MRRFGISMVFILLKYVCGVSVMYLDLMEPA